MINFCKKIYFKTIDFQKRRCDEDEYEKSCIISSFYTIQFISPKKRQNLIDKIYKSLNWGERFFS